MIGKGYISRVLVSIDQAANVILGGNPDETISARTGRDAARGYAWARVVQWALNNIQPDHTNLAIEHDEERAEKVVGIEEDAEKKGE